MNEKVLDYSYISQVSTVVELVKVSMTTDHDEVFTFGAATYMSCSMDESVSTQDKR